jgi:hypothetical protein
MRTLNSLGERGESLYSFSLENFLVYHILLVDGGTTLLLTHNSIPQEFVIVPILKFSFVLQYPEE